MHIQSSSAGRKLLVASAALVVFGAVAVPALFGQDLLGHPAANRVGPDRLYPDPNITLGKAETVDLDDLTSDWECPTSIHKVDCTYSQAHRSVSKKTHTKVYDNYSVPAARRKIKFGEVDHFDPLCNGGSNDIQNLWYQPATNKWNGKNFGYHEKDDLETWICKQVKAGMLDPREAFEKITGDWVKFYMEVKPKHGKSND